MRRGSMNIKTIVLMTAALFSLPIGVYYAAAASSASAATQQGLPVNKPAIAIPEIIAVGPVGSAVARRLIEKGKETILIDKSADSVSRVDVNPNAAD